MKSTATELYNAIRVSDLPAPAAGAKYGIDAVVWQALIDVADARMRERNYSHPFAGGMRGFCLYGSVAAAKFLLHRLRYPKTRVVRVSAPGSLDHYFAIAINGSDRIVCDITCSQFTNGPDYIVGTLKEVEAAARGLTAFHEPLAKSYKAGLKSTDYVV